VAITRALPRSMVLAAFCAGVLVTAARLATTPIEVSPLVGKAGAFDLMHPAALSAPGVSPEDMADILARPIFSPTRRPSVPPPPEAPSQAVPEAVPREPRASGIVLMGVYLRGESRRALLVSSLYPEGRWFHVGDDVGGWALKRVDTGSVEIASPEGTLQLQLYVDKVTTY
jgi:hypothetical protein